MELSSYISASLDEGLGTFRSSISTKKLTMQLIILPAWVMAILLVATRF
ncbi:hypothetical protein LINPERPRIM_LOCUS30714 [Linum perenne]